MQTCDISFITFNYDRSLEQFLYFAFKHWEGLPEDVCVDRVRDLQINHIYGKLGPLDWESENGNAYDGKLTIGKIKKAFSRIIITSESSEISAKSSSARGVLADSEEAHFLGLGYDDENLMKLSINQIQLLLITVKLISLARISEIADSFSSKMRLIFACLPYVNPSFGYNELELAGVLRFKHPTKSDILERELKFLKGQIVNEMKNHSHDGTHLNSGQIKNDHYPSDTSRDKKKNSS